MHNTDRSSERVVLRWIHKKGTRWYIRINHQSYFISFISTKAFPPFENPPPPTASTKHSHHFHSQPPNQHPPTLLPISTPLGPLYNIHHSIWIGRFWMQSLDFPFDLQLLVSLLWVLHCCCCLRLQRKRHVQEADMERQFTKPVIKVYPYVEVEFPLQHEHNYDAFMLLSHHRVRFWWVLPQE